MALRHERLPGHRDGVRRDLQTPHPAVGDRRVRATVNYDNIVRIGRLSGNHGIEDQPRFGTVILAGTPLWVGVIWRDSEQWATARCCSFSCCLSLWPAAMVLLPPSRSQEDDPCGHGHETAHAS